MPENSLSPALRDELRDLVAGFIEDRLPYALNDNEDDEATERFVVEEGHFDARLEENVDGDTVVYLIDRSGRVAQEDAPALARIIVQTGPN